MDLQAQNKLLAIRNGVGAALSFVRSVATRDKIVATTFNDMINEAILAIDSEDREDIPAGRLQQLTVLEQQMALVAEAVETMNLDLDISEFDDTFPEDTFEPDDGSELGEESW